MNKLISTHLAAAVVEFCFVYNPPLDAVARPVEDTGDTVSDI